MSSNKHPIRKIKWLVMNQKGQEFIFIDDNLMYQHLLKAKEGDKFTVVRCNQTPYTPETIDWDV